MKKKQSIIIASAILLILAITACCILLPKYKDRIWKQAEDTEKEQEEGTLEPPRDDLRPNAWDGIEETLYPEGEENVISDIALIEVTGTLGKEADEKIEAAKGLVSDYLSVIFNYKDGKTDNFTQELINFFEDDSKYNGKSERNIYPLFQTVKMNSTYEGLVVKAIHTKKLTDAVYIEFFGYADAHYGNIMLPEGDYSTAINATVQYKDGEYKMCRCDIAGVYDKGQLSMYYTKGSHNKEITIKGEERLIWDMIDVKGFLSGYTYEETEEP